MYRYCKLFGVSPEQYMDTPEHVIEWMLRLDDVHARTQQQQQPGAAPQMPRIS